MSIKPSSSVPKLDLSGLRPVPEAVSKQPLPEPNGKPTTATKKPAVNPRARVRALQLSSKIEGKERLLALADDSAPRKAIVGRVAMSLSGRDEEVEERFLRAYPRLTDDQQTAFERHAAPPSLPALAEPPEAAAPTPTACTPTSTPRLPPLKRAEETSQSPRSVALRKIQESTEAMLAFTKAKQSTPPKPLIASKYAQALTPRLHKSPVPAEHIPTFAPDSPRYAAYPDLPSTLNAPLGARSIDVVSTDSWELLWAAARAHRVLDCRTSLTGILATPPPGAPALKDVRESGADSTMQVPSLELIAREPMAKARALRKQHVTRRTLLASEQSLLPPGVLHPEFARRLLVDGPHLHTIRLIEAGPLALMPDTTFSECFESLRTLWITHCGLIRLPSSIVQLPHLVELLLPRNRIRELPADFGKLTGVKILDLSANKLRSLPESIGACTGLEHLILAENRLTSSILSIPSSFALLSNLKFLDVSHNRLKAIPLCIPRLPSLLRLQASHNRIGTDGPRSIPTELWQCDSLVELHLSSNRIASIPDDVGRLTRLRSLWLSHNHKFTKLPTGLITLKDVIREIRLDGCAMRQPPPDVCSLGAEACILWIKHYLDDGLDRHKRRVIMDLQTLLAEAVAFELVPPSILACRVPISCEPSGSHPYSSQQSDSDSDEEQEGADAEDGELDAAASASRAASQVQKRLRRSKGHKLLPSVLPHFATKAGTLFRIIIPAVNAFRVLRWEYATGKRWIRTLHIVNPLASIFPPPNMAIVAPSAASEASENASVGEDSASVSSDESDDDSDEALKDDLLDANDDSDESDGETDEEHLAMAIVLSPGQSPAVELTAEDARAQQKELRRKERQERIDAFIAQRRAERRAQRREARKRRDALKAKSEKLLGPGRSAVQGRQSLAWAPVYDRLFRDLSESPPPPRLFLWSAEEVLGALAEDHDGFGAAGRAVEGVMFRAAIPQNADDSSVPPLWQVLLVQSHLVEMGNLVATEFQRESARLAAEAAGKVVEQSDEVITIDPTKMKQSALTRDSMDQDSKVTTSGPGAPDPSTAVPARKDDAASSSNPPDHKVDVAPALRVDTAQHTRLASLVGTTIAVSKIKSKWQKVAETLLQHVSDSELEATGLVHSPGVGVPAAALCIRSRLYAQGFWTEAMRRRKESTEKSAKVQAARAAVISALTSEEGSAKLVAAVREAFDSRQQAANIAASRVALLRRRAAEAATLDKERMGLVKARELAVAQLKAKRAVQRMEAEMAQKEATAAEMVGLPDYREKRAKARQARGFVRDTTRDIRGGRVEQAFLRRLHTRFLSIRDAAAIADHGAKPVLQQAAETLQEVIKTFGGAPASKALGDPLPSFASDGSRCLWVWRARLREEAQEWGRLLGAVKHCLPPERVELDVLREGAMDRAGASTEEETTRAFYLLRSTAASWRALGVRSMLAQWKSWSDVHKAERTAKKGEKKEARKREAAEAKAMLELAAAEKAKWEKKWDDFNDKWYWQHQETQEIRLTEPEGNEAFVDRRGKLPDTPVKQPESPSGALTPAAVVPSWGVEDVEESPEEPAAPAIGPAGGRVPTPPWVHRGLQLPRLDHLKQVVESTTHVLVENDHAKKLGE
jgi:hypothetical protein